MSAEDLCGFSQGGRSFLAATLREGLVGRSLVGTPTVRPLPHTKASTSSRSHDVAESVPSLWSPGLPVVAVAQTGTPVVAVVLGDRPGAAAAAHDATTASEVTGSSSPSLPTHISSDRGETAHSASLYTARKTSADAEDTTRQGDSLRDRLTPEQSRRHVYLFDARNGAFIAELYFRGSVIQHVAANAQVLVVMLADAFHVVALDTLQHLRKQDMYTPLNPRGILALSPTTEDVPTRCRIAFPHHGSSRFGSGDGGVLVLTLTRQAASSGTAAAPHKGKAGPSGAAAVASAHAPHEEQIEGAGLQKDKGAAIPTSAMTEEDAAADVYRQSQRAVKAHSSAVTALALSGHAWDFLATASHKGSCVRLFDAESGVLLHELQYRGGAAAGAGVPAAMSAAGGPAGSPHGVCQLSISPNMSLVAVLLDTQVLLVFDCMRVVRLWTRSRQRAWLDAQQDATAPTEKKAARPAWGSVAWATARVKAAAAGVSPSTETGVTQPMANSAETAAVERSAACMKRLVTPIFNRQDAEADVPLATVQISHAMAFAEENQIWVGLYGVGAAANDCARTEERCTLQRFEVPLDRRPASGLASFLPASSGRYLPCDQRELLL